MRKPLVCAALVAIAATVMLVGAFLRRNVGDPGTLIVSGRVMDEAQLKIIRDRKLLGKSEQIQHFFSELSDDNRTTIGFATDKNFVLYSNYPTNHQLIVPFSMIVHVEENSAEIPVARGGTAPENGTTITITFEDGALLSYLYFTLPAKKGSGQSFYEYLASKINWTEDRSVLSGKELNEGHTKIIRDLALIGGSEEIQYFYSPVASNIQNNMLFITDRKLVLYTEGSKPKELLLPFPRIKHAHIGTTNFPMVIGATRLTKGSKLSLTLDNGHQLSFVLPAHKGADQAFYDYLKSKINRSVEQKHGR